MAHAKTAIIGAVITAISGNGVTPERTRVYPQDEANLPAYMVYPESDVIDYSMSTADGITRIMTLKVEIVVKAASSAVEDLLFSHEEYIENQIGDDVLADIKRISLTGAEYEWSGDGQEAMGIATLTFSVLYRTLRGSASTAIA